MDNRSAISSSNDVLKKVFSFLKGDSALLESTAVCKRFNELTKADTAEMKKQHDVDMPELMEIVKQLKINLSAIVNFTATKKIDRYRLVLSTYSQTLGDFLENISRLTVTQETMPLIRHVAKHYSRADSIAAGYYLMKAIENGYADVSLDLADIFIKNGADVNVIEAGMTTSLHLAVRRNSMPLTKLLLKNGANPNPGTVKKPLMLAAEKGLTDIAKKLLKHRADATAMNSAGQTAALIADKKGFVNCSKAIDEHAKSRSNRYLQRTNSVISRVNYFHQTKDDSKNLSLDYVSQQECRPNQ